MKYNNINITEFWYEETTNEVIQIKISKGLLIKCIEDLGYRKHKLKGSYVIVKIENDKIVDVAPDFQIRDDIKDFLLSNKQFKVWEAFLRINNLASYIIESIQSIDIEYNYGDKETGYLFFMNGVLEIKANSLNLISYSDYPNYLWKSQIIQRNFSELEDKEQSVFRDFCWLLSESNDKSHLNLLSVIGYILHSYKDPTMTRAVIFVDKNMDGENNSANGGTGKSLLIQCISKLIPSLFRNGKNADANEKFYFADLQLFHRLVVFDDVSEDFDFESLYSVITGDLPIERKYKNAMVIPFKDSPKIVITSNYPVGNRLGNSEERRKIEYEVSGYFRDNKTPYQEFGHNFFEDWNGSEWQKFDNFAVSTIQHYLRNGVIELTNSNIVKSHIIKQTSSDFVRFMEYASKNPITFGGNINENGVIRLDKSILYDTYKNSLKNYTGFTTIKFKQWIDIYFSMLKIEYNHFKSNSKAFVEFMPIE